MRFESSRDCVEGDLNSFGSDFDISVEAQSTVMKVLVVSYKYLKVSTIFSTLCFSVHVLLSGITFLKATILCLVAHTHILHLFSYCSLASGGHIVVSQRSKFLQLCKQPNSPFAVVTPCQTLVGYRMCAVREWLLDTAKYVFLCVRSCRERVECCDVLCNERPYAVH